MNQMRKPLKAVWSSTRLFRKICKGILILAVCLGVLCALLYATLYAVYSVKLKREVAAFVAEGGKLEIHEIVPLRDTIDRAEGWDLGDGARYLKAAGLLCESPMHMARKRQLRKIEEDVDAAAISEENKINLAWERFQQWPGLALRRTEGATPASGPESPSSTEIRKATAFNDAWLPYLEEYLRHNSIVLELTKRGAEIGEGPFDVDWNKPYQQILYHLTMLRAEGRLLRVDAVVRARKGDMPGAMEDIRSILRLRRTIAGDPGLISLLVGIALDDAGFGALQGVLEFGHPDRAGIESVLRELDGREDNNAVAPVLYGETTFGITLFNNLREDSSEFYSFFPFAPPNLFAGMRRFFWIGPADEYCFVRMMRSKIAAAKAGDASLDDVSSSYGNSESAIVIGLYPLGRALASVLNSERLLAAQARANATVRAARVVLVANMYYLDEGGYPDSIEALAARYKMAVPVDPFSGKPLVYERRGEGFIVSTAGDVVWERPK